LRITLSLSRGENSTHLPPRDNERVIRNIPIMCLLAAAAVAAPRPIDTAGSKITIVVGKAGAFSAFGHDHDISAPVASGNVDTDARRVEFTVRSASMKVMDPKASDKDREEVQKAMVGPEVLDVEKYPEIRFRSVTAERSGDSWAVKGELTLHGQTQPVTVSVKEQAGHYTGSAKIKQTDFGIKPIKAAGGAVKVKDELRIDFDIQLAR
jgi:polyisoprenoid-binding protein YceI